MQLTGEATSDPAKMIMETVRAAADQAAAAYRGAVEPVLEPDAALPGQIEIPDPGQTDPAG